MVLVLLLLLLAPWCHAQTSCAAADQIKAYHVAVDNNGWPYWRVFSVSLVDVYHNGSTYDYKAYVSWGDSPADAGFIYQLGTFYCTIGSVPAFQMDMFGRTVGPPCSCAGDPINISSGNEFYKEEDADLGVLSLQRYYNSQYLVGPSTIGVAWRHSFERSLSYSTATSPATVTLYRPNEQWMVFTQVGSAWVPDTDMADTLVSTTDGSGNITGWTLFDADTLEHENYNASGQLVSILEPNQELITLAYSTSSTPTSIAPKAGLLITVTDGKGRQLSFTYNGYSHLKTVTLPDGGVLTYTYDASDATLTQVTYPDTKTRKYVYNESSQVSGTSLPLSMTGTIDETATRYLTLSYDSTGRATKSQLAGSVDTTSVTYNSDGTSTVTYPTGSSATFTFAYTGGSQHTVAVSAPCGTACGQPNAAATYDANGYPATTTDFNGNLAKTTYDTNGLLDQRIDASGSTSQRTTAFTWNTTLRLPLTRIVLDASSNTVSNTQWVYNNAGQTLARCDIDPTNSAASGYSCSNIGTVPVGVRRSTYTYCTAVNTTQCPIVGLMLTATGPRTDATQTTTYSYYLTSSATNCGTPGTACYQAGDLHTVTDPQGHITTIASYDADGRPTRITDANGTNTDMTYTPRGWLTSRSVGGAQTSFGYTPYGAVQTVTDADGVITTYGYDTAHRLTKITDAQGNYVQYTLDAVGNKTAEQVYDATGALHKSLSRTFNTLGQLTKVMDGLSHTVFDASASGSYDANGNLVQSADGLGIQRQLGYDALNRLVQMLDNYNGTN